MWANGEYQEWLAWDPEREVEVTFDVKIGHCLISGGEAANQERQWACGGGEAEETGLPPAA